MNASKVETILDICDSYSIEIISYGLAPNPFGFCYEAPDEVESEVKHELNGLLDALSGSEESELKQYIFGEE